MKKLICTILSLALALSMVGCGDTAPVQTEPTVTPEPAATAEPTPEPLHCDFEIMVESYQTENAIDSLPEEGSYELFAFKQNLFASLYAQGVAPNSFACENTLLAEYTEFFDSKERILPLGRGQVPPSPSADDGITLSDDGNTMTNTSGFSFEKSDIGFFIPHDQVERYVYEHCGEETAKLYRLVYDSGYYSRINGGNFCDYAEVIQMHCFSMVSSFWLEQDGFKTVDEELVYSIKSDHHILTASGTQSSDEAW